MSPAIQEVAAADEVKLLLPQIAERKTLRVLGLMTMASLEGGGDQARATFAACASGDQLVASCPPRILLNELDGHERRL
jgi:uncharacterized pyridoxal phosphate-containing UPF0001 family protein